MKFILCNQDDEAFELDEKNSWVLAFGAKAQLDFSELSTIEINNAVREGRLGIPLGKIVEFFRTYQDEFEMLKQFIDARTPSVIAFDPSMNQGDEGTSNKVTFLASEENDWDEDEDEDERDWDEDEDERD